MPVFLPVKFATITIQHLRGILGKLELNPESVSHYFDGQSRKVFSYTKLAEVLIKNRAQWNLPQSIGPRNFIEFLLQQTQMQPIQIVSENDYDPAVRYVCGPAVSSLSVAISVKPSAYCTHESALWIHQLGGARVARWPSRSSPRVRRAGAPRHRRSFKNRVP